MITLSLASAHLSSPPPNFPRPTGSAAPAATSSPDPPALLTSSPAGDRLAARRDPQHVPVDAYTCQRGRPGALIHPPDRRCPDTLRRDPPVNVPGRPPRHDPGAGEPGARPLRAGRWTRCAAYSLTAQRSPEPTHPKGGQGDFGRSVECSRRRSCRRPVPARSAGKKPAGDHEKQLPGHANPITDCD